jgi:hypothetical protein
MRSHFLASLTTAGLQLLAAGCSGEPPARPRVNGTTTIPVVTASAIAPASPEAPPRFDSTLSRVDVMRRLQREFDSVDHLAGGTSSREELVRRFLEALSAGDSSALRDLAVTKQEFAWIYYPTATMGLPPYDVRADLLWYLVERRGYHGFHQLLRQRGRQPLEYRSHRCAPEPTVEGSNQIWGPCSVSYRPKDGAPVRERLFGLIIERHGRFKFVSYSNPLD